MELTGTSQLLRASSCYSHRKVETVSRSVKMLEEPEVGQLEKTGSLAIMVRDEIHQCMTEQVLQGEGPPSKAGHSSSLFSMGDQ